MKVFFIALCTVTLIFFIQGCTRPRSNDLTPPSQDSTTPRSNPGPPSTALDSAMTIYDPEWDSLYAFNAWDGSKKWSLKISDLQYGLPTYGEGTLYLSLNNKKFIAVDTTGKIRWTKMIEGDISDYYAAVNNGFVYINDGNGNIYALDAASGNTSWQLKKLGTSHGYLVLKNGVIYYNAGKLYAIDALTGKIIWSTYTGGSDRPVVYLGKIYARGVSTRNGDEVKVINRSTGALVQTVVVFGSLLSMNAGNGYLYCMFYDIAGFPNGVSAFDTTNFSMKWSVHGFNGQAGPSYPASGSYPAITDSFIIINTLRGTTFYDAYSGKISWQSNVEGTYVNNTFYGSSRVTNAFFDGHIIFAFDRAKNVIKWRSTQLDSESSGPLRVVRKSDKVYIDGMVSP